jgi:toxin ParE1/3/4
LTEIEWSRAARRDFDAIWRWTEEVRGPAAAALIGNRLLDSIEHLRLHPRIGRPGLRKGTRELVIGQTPYLAIYVAGRTRVRIVRLIHGARQRS